MEKHVATFNFILDTVSADHDINAYLALLARDGTLTLVGAPPKPLGVAAFSLIVGRHNLSGSSIGSIAETQEMLDFCGDHNITADVEVIPIQKVNEAYERLLKSDVNLCVASAFLCASAVQSLFRLSHRRDAEERRGYAERFFILGQSLVHLTVF